MPLTVHHIDSLDDPDLAPYRTMRRQEEHRKQGLFVAEGEKVVRRLLASDFKIVSVLLPEKWFQELAPLIEARREAIRAYVASKETLEMLTGFSVYQGVLAVGQVPRRGSMQALLDSPSPRLFVAVDGLSNAENLGALVRNCVAFGVQGLLAGETSSSPFLRRAVRSSMGTIFRLPVVEVASLVESLQALRRHGVRLVAAHPHAPGRNLGPARLDGDCCLVFGGEGHGVSAAVLAMCDEAVAIPMQNGVDSLNVGSASAVLLYEAARQRGKA